MTEDEIYQMELADKLAEYKARFNDDLPKSEVPLSDFDKIRLIYRCLDADKSVDELGEDWFLQWQYETKFPGCGLIPTMMVLMSEEEWRQTMRECLRAGKPYELPADVRRLMDEGAVF